MRHVKRTVAVCLAVLMLAAVLGGCAKKPTVQPEVSPTPAASADPAPAPEKVQTQDPEGSVSVSTPEELLEAIAPGAYIIVEAGKYNLTPYMRELLNGDGYDVWTEEHPYVDVADYGNVQATIIGVDGLTIAGREGESVEIVIESYSEDVLNFELCTDLTLENLTLGHDVEKGECTGDVLEFYDCSGVELNGLDLYGCGAYGIVARFCHGLIMNASTIRECTYGLMDIGSCTDFVFNDCDMKDCEGYDMIDTSFSCLTFNGCRFDGNNGVWSFVSEQSGHLARFFGCTFGSWETRQLQELVGSGTILLDNDCRFTGASVNTAITVTDVEDLAEAIRPGAAILIAPGRYNMSEWLDEVWEKKGEAWNWDHAYVRIEKCFDGLQLVVTGADGLIISGGGETCADVEIVVEPRYANVLGFEDCEGVTVCDLTAGHTDTGECSGSVVYCEGCTGVVLANDDLYGCGVSGLETESSADIYLYKTTIRDCSLCPMEISDCTGNLAAYHSRFVNSGFFGFYGCDEADIYFYACEFGERESNSLYFRDDVQTDDCIWSEITEYPEYPDYEEGYGDFRDELEIVAFDKEVLAGTKWRGFELSVPEAGYVYALPHENEEGTLDVVLEFDKNGVDGKLTGLYEDPETFDYEVDESGYVAYAHPDIAPDSFDYIWLYADRDADESPLYMEFASGECVVWLNFEN